MRTPEERQAEREAQAAAALSQEGALAQFQQQFDDPSFWGAGEGDYARFDPTYGLQLRGSDGAFRNVGLGEHAESNSYLQAAADDPMYDRFIAYANQHEGSLTPEQRQLMTLVGGDTWGQSKLRGWGAIDPYASELTGHQAGTMLQTGFGDSLTPEQRQAGNYFNWYESPAQQSARSDDGGFFGSLGGLGQLAMLAALVYSGGAAAGAWGAGEGALAAGEGLYGLELGGAGVGVADLGAGYLTPEYLAAADASAGLMPEYGQLGFADKLGNWWDATSNNPLVKGVSNVRKGLSAADGLSKMLNPEERPTSVSGLTQYQQQPQQGYQPSRAFGYNNFNAVRG